MKKESTYNDFISRPEISFWIPIISSSVVLAMSWFNLSARIDLLTQKVDLIIQQQSNTLTIMQGKEAELEVKYASMQKQWGELSQRVTRIEK